MSARQDRAVRRMAVQCPATCGECGEELEADDALEEWCPRCCETVQVLGGWASRSKTTLNKETTCKD